MRPPTHVTTHLMELYPPEPRRDTWLVVCSQKDFTRSYLSRSSAIIAANTHGSDIETMNELERGIYRFDKGEE